jgi:hypothetical protein
MNGRRLPIVRPCDRDWDSMPGDERRRHCANCDRDVLNLSALTESEAAGLLAETRGPVCVRYRSDAASGEIAFRPARPRGLARHARAAALAAALLAAPSVYADASIPPVQQSSTKPRRRVGTAKGANGVVPSSERPAPSAKRPAPPERKPKEREFEDYLGGIDL